MKRIFYLDWGNVEAEAGYQGLCSRYPYVSRLPVATTLADSVRQCAIITDTEYFWVASSLTDYSNFNFEEYSEMGLEPYLQVFGHNTWLAGRHYIRKLPWDIEPIEAFPDLHFVESKTLKSLVTPLDIVYISNGEAMAEKHYQHLLNSVKTGNKIHRIDGVNGRTAAYHAAASASTTSWFYAVFAKIEVNSNFNWSWIPDQVNGPKHYIFTATNPVNGLEYGHMAVVAYNKALTLNTLSTGLDFILSKPHEVKKVNSGIAKFNTDPIVTWRTAFRECLKLKLSSDHGDAEKLHIWLTIGNGFNGIWSQAGARDAVDYFNTVNGNFNDLLLSYDWAWLNQYFQQKYNRLDSLQYTLLLDL